MKLALAQAIISGALARARADKSNPVCVVVVDAGGHCVASAREDGCGLARHGLSLTKAQSALALGLSTRQLAAFWESNQALHAVLREATGSPLLPVAGGVIVREADGAVLGAAGISGGSLAVEEDYLIETLRALSVSA